MGGATWAFAIALFVAPATALADDAYEPSTFRIEAGPIFWVPFYAQNFDIYAIGGTVAFDAFLDKQRIFSVGGRLAFLGDPQGIGKGYVGGYADAEVGARPRLFARGKNAFALVLRAGFGAGFIDGLPFSPPVTSFVHLALRGGVAFDAGVFTMAALAGISMLGNGDGAGGAVEAL